MKSFKTFDNWKPHNAYEPSDADYQHVYTQRKAGKTDRRIVMGDESIPPLGLTRWDSFKSHFDSDKAKSRPDYHPPAADNRSGLTDAHYNQVYRLRYSGHPETHIQKTMKIHKDTIAKYIDSDEAKTRPNYHPPGRKRK